MKILVTGINGFVGHHVARQLQEQGHTILGVGDQPSLSHELDEIVDRYISCDLTDPELVGNIDLSGITAIINLAGFAKVGDSKGKGELYDRVNVGVHTVLYEECLRQSVHPRIIAISSGAVYDPNQTLPLTESSSLLEDDKAIEYIISKKKMEKAVLDFNSRGLTCIIVRPFNHSGPGQRPGFLLPDLGEQIIQAKIQSKPLLVGNLKTKRDYTDVRDVARAYVLLATCSQSKIKHNLYNICSGTSTSGEEILELMKKHFDATKITTTIDRSRIRQNEIMEIYGSHERITQDTGWKPEISIDQMVKDYANWKISSN